MNKTLSSTLIALGVMIFVFLAGYYYRGTQIRTGPPKMIVIERPVEIPAKADSAEGRPIRPNADRINLIDSLTTEALRADSLAEWVETLSTPFQTVFEDTLSVKDSLGSFYSRRIDSLDIDPLTRWVKRRISYLDSKLTTVKIEQEILVGETWLDTVLYWLERAAYFALGVLTGKQF